MNSHNLFSRSFLIRTAYGFGLSLAILPVQAQKTSAPEFSPDGLYQHVHIMDSNFNHTFQLFPAGQPDKAVQTKTYERGTALIWAPDHRHFAINNYGGSNFTQTELYALPEQSAPVNVLAEAKCKRDSEQTRIPDSTADQDAVIRPNHYEAKQDYLTTPFWEAFSRNYRLSEVFFLHNYIHAVAWLDNQTLLLGSHAYNVSSQNAAVNVAEFWCQLYSLKTGLMSTDLKAYNEEDTTLPQRKLLPNNNLIISLQQPDIKQAMPAAADTPPNPAGGNVIYALPKKEGGQQFELSSRGGVFRCTETTADATKEHDFYPWLVVNDHRNGPVCDLYRSNNDGHFHKNLDLAALFVKHAQWEPWVSQNKDFNTDIYVLGVLDETHLLMQGCVRDRSNTQLAGKTLIFNMVDSTFSEDLPSLNDSKVHLYTPAHR